MSSINSQKIKHKSYGEASVTLPEGTYTLSELKSYVTLLNNMNKAAKRCLSLSDRK